LVAALEAKVIRTTLEVAPDGRLKILYVLAKPWQPAGCQEWGLDGYGITHRTRSAPAN
jgi:hypothetical protein